VSIAAMIIARPAMVMARRDRSKGGLLSGAQRFLECYARD
jgi:hypothetical protein